MTCDRPTHLLPSTVFTNLLQQSLLLGLHIFLSPLSMLGWDRKGLLQCHASSTESR